MHKFIYSLLLCFALLACQKADVTKIDIVHPQTKGKIDVIGEKTPMLEGRIKYLAFEGGFYGIIAKNGDKLLPLNLKKEFHQSGAIVKFKGHEATDVMTIQQWGTPFKLTHIEIVVAGSASPHPES